MRLKAQPQARQSEIPVVVAALFTGEVSHSDLDPADRDFIRDLRFFGSTGDERDLWGKYAEALTARAAQKTPGRRPRGWWTFAAPRCSDDQLRAWHYFPVHPFFNPVSANERPCEPRLRFGGTGTPKFEVLAHAPAFSFGIPFQWISEKEADLYSGRLLDIHGKVVLPQYIGKSFAGVPIDPGNPPVFESQASYLKRHGLFLPGEEKRLTALNFEPETIALTEVNK